MLKSRVSLGDFLHLPEQKPALEWRRGEVVEKAMPTELPAILQLTIGSVLRAWARSTGAGRVLTEARSTVLAENDPRSVVPDVSFVAACHVQGPPRHRHLPTAPDLAIEILSPGQTFGAIQDRVNWFLGHGSSLAWVIDGLDRGVTVFRQGAAPAVLRAADALSDPLLPGFVLTVEALFDEADLGEPGEQPEARG